MLRGGIFLLWSLSLFAEGMDEAALEGIYTEAAWFVAVIAVMSVVSFVISRRNARKYEEQMLREKEKKKSEVVDVPAVKESDADVKEPEVDKLLELAQLHKDGLLSHEEFMAFKTTLYREIKESHVSS